MKTKALSLWALLVGLAWGVSGSAEAQGYAPQIIGFETRCGSATAPSPTTTDLVFGDYAAIDATEFQLCGVQSVSSLNAANVIGPVKFHRPNNNNPFNTVSGMTGSWVLMGSTVLDLPVQTSSLVLTFSPPVNELEFDVLSVDNPTGLTITVTRGTSNTQINPTPDGSQKAHVVVPATAVPINSVSIRYTPPGGLVIADGWFLDELKFNAWRCGDGQREGAEECDDGDSVHCDTCGTDCKVTKDGCLVSGQVCKLPAEVTQESFGCATCTLSTPAVSRTADHVPAPAQNGNTCVSGQFCQIDEMCMNGACTGVARDCADTLSCTADSCDENANHCVNALSEGSCLIDGACFASGEENPSNECLQCSRTASTTAWTPKPGIPCGFGSCSNGTLTPAPRCSATGTCDTQTPVSCDGAVCADPTSCNGACDDDNDCLKDTYCHSGLCIDDLPIGEPCDRDSQCDSNFCVDGVCCNASCDGACVNCALEGSVGMCSPYEAGVDPDQDCPDAQFCGGDGRCVGENRPDGSDCDDAAQCASGFCADGVCCNAACDRSCETCDLVDSEGVCTPYRGGTDPEMECPTAQLCAAPGVCAPENRPIGSECTDDAFCASGHCADGVCCDMACDGVCEACNTGEQPGMCVAFSAGTDPESECSGEAVCSGERACIEYETRGNGLCSAAPGARGSLGFGSALLALAALLRRRRQKGRAASRI